MRGASHVAEALVGLAALLLLARNGSAALLPRVECGCEADFRHVPGLNDLRVFAKLSGTACPAGLAISLPFTTNRSVSIHLPSSEMLESLQ